MRIFNTVIIIINTLLFLALGIFLISLGLTETTARGLADFLHGVETAVLASPSARVLAVSAGVVFVLVSISTVVGNIRSRRYERTVVLHTPLGEVLIALGALEDMGKVIRSEVEGLKDIKMRVSARRKRLGVTAKVVLWSDCSLAKATEQTQDAIRRYLHDILGGEQDIRPRVVVSKVVFRDTEADTRELPRRKSSYRGPLA
jgi:hypothetical protein